MKKQLFCLLLITAITLQSCKKHDDPIPTVNIPKTSYVVSSDGAMVEVFLQTDAIVESKFEAEVNWITKVQTKASHLDMVMFECKPNETFAERSVTVSFYVPNTAVVKTVEIKQLAKNDIQPEITSFSFLVKDNPDKLLDDVHGVIEEDGTISVRIPYILVNKKLVPSIKYNGKSVAHTTEGELDFVKPIKYEVINTTGAKAEYTVMTNSYTGLPVVTIETEKRYINPDKEIYVKGSVTIDGTKEFPELFSSTTRLKGRGNATWQHAKKPFRLKLDKKASVLGMPEDKDWVLLAGYCDKSLMRLDLYLETSRILGMEWTPRMEFVELFLNGRYEGNYMMGEHVKTSQNRLNVDEGNGGMLIECDPYFASEPVYFHTSKNHPYTFKTPDPDGITPEQIEYSKGVMNDFEARLFSADFKDPENGYRAVIDVENFAAWWLINNVCKNIDMNRYFYKYDKASKLRMGPVWDAEWSFGIGWNNEGPAIVDELLVINNYFDRLLQDQYFRSVVAKIWDEKKEQIKTQILGRINTNYKLLEYSQEANFARWNVLNSFLAVGYVALTTYNNEVQYVKDFFLKRYDWLDHRLNTYK